MKDAFSFTNRLRLGQAKGGLGFNSMDSGGIIYDNGQVGCTSIPNSDVWPNA